MGPQRGDRPDSGRFDRSAPSRSHFLPVPLHRPWIGHRHHLRCSLAVGVAFFGSAAPPSGAASLAGLPVLFLSHSGADSATANYLACRLPEASLGTRCCLEPSSRLLPGAYWVRCGGDRAESGRKSYRKTLTPLRHETATAAGAGRGSGGRGCSPLARFARGCMLPLQPAVRRSAFVATAQIHERHGGIEQAIVTYQRFLTLRPDADPVSRITLSPGTVSRSAPPHRLLFRLRLPLPDRR